MQSDEFIRGSLTTAMESAIKIRFEFQYPEFGSESIDLHRALVNIQDNLTMLEKTLGSVTGIKAALDRSVAHARLVWQEAWDRAISKPSKRISLTEYATGKEKAAEANLASLEEARELRQREELLSLANEAVDVVRLHYYGLDKVRQDLRKRLDLSQMDYYS